MAVLLSGLLSRIAAGLVTLVASFLAFHTAHAAASVSARRQLHNDVYNYVARSERHVSEWLTAVEQHFMSEFEAFRHAGTRSAEGSS